MEEQLISFETAKLAKEKGFDLYQTFSYWEGELTPHTPGYALEDGKTSQENYFNFERYYAPTQSLLQKWLREEHNIHLIAYKNINIDGYDWCYITTDGITNINSYKTYEEALEVGLQEALKLVKF